MLATTTDQVIGLDLGSTAVRGVALDSGPGERLRVLFAETEPTSAATAQANRAGAIEAAAARLLERCPWRRPGVAVAVGGPGVTIRRMVLPALTEDTLRQRVRDMAADLLPSGHEAMRLDHQVVATDPRAGAAGAMTVLLAAAREDEVRRIAELVRRAGGRPRFVDVDACALQNAYERWEGAASFQSTLLLHVGVRTSLVVVCRPGEPLFTRELPWGGDHGTVAVQESLGVSREEAERVKRTRTRASHHEAAVRRALERSAEELVRDVATTIEVVQDRVGLGRLDAVAISGGGARSPGLAETLEASLHVRVEPWDPLAGVAGREAAPAGGTDGTAGELALAVGLALRG